MKLLITGLLLMGSISSYANEWQSYWDSFGGSIMSVKGHEKLDVNGDEKTGVSVEVRGCVATLGLSDIAFILGLKNFKPNLKSCDENEIIIAPTYYRTTYADNCMDYTKKIFVPVPEDCNFNAETGKVIIDHNFEEQI